jgi:hypothetical protein
MKLVEKYFLIVIGSFNRKPIIYDNYPSEEVIIKAIIEQEGKSAIVEKRFVIESEKVSV